MIINQKAETKIILNKIKKKERKKKDIYLSLKQTEIFINYKEKILIIKFPLKPFQYLQNYLLNLIIIKIKNIFISFK